MAEDRTEGVMKAAELLEKDHPLHDTFVLWCERTFEQGGVTRRRARRFLRQYPQYRYMRAA